MTNPTHPTKKKTKDNSDLYLSLSCAGKEGTCGKPARHPVHVDGGGAYGLCESCFQRWRKNLSISQAEWDRRFQEEANRSSLSSRPAPIQPVNLKPKTPEKWETLDDIEQRIAYIKKYRLGSDYCNGFSSIESGECCDKCRMDKKSVLKSGRATALRMLVGCKDPFQINCKCHIPFRKVATASELALLEELSSQRIQDREEMIRKVKEIKNPISFMVEMGNEERTRQFQETSDLTFKATKDFILSLLKDKKK